MRTLITPIVNINGTPQERLVEAYANAAAAVSEAISRLMDTYPHGRDYQTERTGERLKRACEEHASRLRRLHGVLAELHVLADGVAERALTVETDANIY